MTGKSLWKSAVFAAALGASGLTPIAANAVESSDPIKIALSFLTTSLTTSLTTGQTERLGLPFTVIHAGTDAAIFAELDSAYQRKA